MTYENICRIPGRNGSFRVCYKNGKLENLQPVQEQNLEDSSLWLTAGLFDIQLNGMLGYDLSSPDLCVDHVIKISKALKKRGILRWCPTICSETPETVEHCLDIIRQAVDGGNAPEIHCIHLEGHYISSEEGYRGVHLPKFIRDPDIREFDRWQKIAGGHIGLFSLAPERKGALAFIQKLRSANVKVGLVHHHADHTTVRAAAVAGADLSSHLINGCVPLINRQHNVIWSQLSLDELWASFIADGFHIPSYTLRAALRAKGISRSILISDLASLSGLPDGEYQANEMTVVLKDGGLWVKDKGTNLLSGAAKTLDQDVTYLVKEAGFPIEDALLMASVNPARYFGVEAEFQLYPGKAGPLAVFSWKDGSLKVQDILAE